jgi:hypothetical protein
MKSFPAMRQRLGFRASRAASHREKLRVGQRPERPFGATRCHPNTPAPVLLPEKKMIRSSRIAPLLLLPLFVAGCSSSESKLEPIASKLQEAANRCVADVIERKMAYENSTHCRSLSGIAQGYIQAGGFTDKTSCPADRIAETARARAWKALAVSRTGDAGLAVW